MTYYRTYEEYIVASRCKAARQASIDAMPAGGVRQHDDDLMAKTPHYDPQVARALRRLGFIWSRFDRVWLWTTWTVEPGDGDVDHKLVMRPNLEAVRQDVMQKAQAVLAKHYAVEETA